MSNVSSLKKLVSEYSSEKTNGEYSKDLYRSTIGYLKRDIAEYRNLTVKHTNLLSELKDMEHEYFTMMDAKKILSAVSDDNTTEVLRFVTGVINKVLKEIFPNNTRRIQLSKKLYAGMKPHINVEIVNEDGFVLDIGDQEGAGVGQIISVLYTICLIEIRKGRRLVLLDEKLNGLHKKAKQIMAEIIKIFSEGGFQFIFVEYSLNDLGKVYLIENHDGTSKIVPYSGEYEDEVAYVSDTEDVDLSVLSSEYVDESTPTGNDFGQEIIIS